MTEVFATSGFLFEGGVLDEIQDLKTCLWFPRPYSSLLIKLKLVIEIMHFGDQLAVGMEIGTEEQCMYANLNSLEGI